MKPRGNRGGWPHVSGFRGQNHEDGLERIFREVVIARYPSADAENQSTVPADQFRERFFIAGGDKEGEQLAIISRSQAICATVAKVTHQARELRGWHT